MVHFTDYVRDRYIAPGVSRFQSAEIPDMTNYDSQSSFWVANHFLNTVLRGRLKPRASAYVYNYLRRAEGAFSEHALAREATQGFLASGGQSPSRYASSILHWEFFLSQSWQGYALLRKLIEELSGQPSPLFKRGDGSVEERLNSLYNSMKHVEKRINADQILEDATAPVWLTKEGIQSTDAMLTYAETGEILKDIAKWANVVVEPREMASKLRELD